MAHACGDMAQTRSLQLAWQTNSTGRRGSTRPPRLCPQVMSTGGDENADDDDEVVTGKYCVGHDGVLEYLCHAPSTCTHLVTSIRNLGALVSVRVLHASLLAACVCVEESVCVCVFMCRCVSVWVCVSMCV